MNAVTQSFYDKMTTDPALAGLLATYGGAPAVFTADPAPGNATLPYLVTAGAVARVPFDTKTTRGLDLRRDVRCYAANDGSAFVVDAIAERVWNLFHRQALTISGFGVWLTECSGPLAADEQQAYGRIVTVRLVMEMVP
jgi:hypothetical protein